jgi:DNA polymerase III subunit epsilon
LRNAVGALLWTISAQDIENRNGKTVLASEATITFVDFEGTGSVPGFADEPWQIGLVLLREGEIVPQSLTSQYLQIGERPFSHYAPGRHAELRDELGVSPQLPALWNTLRHWFDNHAMAAHNIATEKRYLRKAFPMLRLPGWIDTLTLARSAYPGLRSYALEDLIKTFDMHAALDSLVPGRDAHDALYDAVASALLFQQLVSTPPWDGLTLDAIRTVRPAKKG